MRGSPRRVAASGGIGSSRRVGLPVGLVFAFVVMTLTACTGSDTAGHSQDSATVTTESPGSTTTVTATEREAGSGSEPGADVSSDDEVDGMEAELPSTLTIVGASRPLISWEAVESAVAYRVLVITDDATWAWEGSDTALLVGGGEEIDRLGPGFELSGPAEVWWQAIGVDDGVLAATIESVPGP